MRHRHTRVCCLAAALLLALAGCGEAPQATAPAASPGVGSVILIHPDGSSAAMFAATRALYLGPDENLHWDTLPHLAVYRGHMADSLTATSHGGGTTHAHGRKNISDSYGLDGTRPIADDRGDSMSVMKQAIAAGIPSGVVNSGTNTEPGTGCFLASVPSRKMHEQIADQIIHAGAKVILGGGERYFLPRGYEGRYGLGVREDGRDLVAEARKLGYTVVFTRAELEALPQDTTMVLGLFAHEHTFHDTSEEELIDKGLPMYGPQAPTLAEMTQAALMVLRNTGPQFFLVVEEEGTDNFANRNNAAGAMLAAKRADDAIGVALGFLEEHPDTLLLTAADSNASGMHAIGFHGKPAPRVLPGNDPNGAPLDGVNGTGTEPFMAKPDRAGNIFPFAIAWTSRSDVTGGVIAKAAGLNAEYCRMNIDNTQITHLIRLTLFGQGAPQLDPNPSHPLPTP